MSANATTGNGSRGLLAALLLALAVGACGPGATAEQLTWCAENQDEVGRAALQLGLINDPLTYSVWKEDNPNDYERACIAAFEEA